MTASGGLQSDASRAVYSEDVVTYVDDAIAESESDGLYGDVALGLVSQVAGQSDDEDEWEDENEPKEVRACTDATDTSPERPASARPAAPRDATPRHRRRHSPPSFVEFRGGGGYRATRAPSARLERTSRANVSGARDSSVNLVSSTGAPHPRYAEPDRLPLPDPTSPSPTTTRRCVGSARRSA